MDGVIELLLYVQENDGVIPRTRYALKKEVTSRLYSANISFDSFCSTCFTIIRPEDGVYRCHNPLCVNPLPRPAKIGKLYSSSLVWQLFVVLKNYVQTTDSNNKFLLLKLRINADGAPLAKSKIGPSIWPVTANITNLPKHCRFHPSCTLLLGLWQGPCKPKLDQLLSFCFNQLEAFRRPQGVALHFSQDCVVNVKIAIDLFIGDAPARSEATNMVGHAGYYGCLNCFSRGEYLFGAVRYPFVPYDELDIRGNNEIAEVGATMNVNNEHYLGVKPGVTTLSQFDVQIPFQTPPDCMHVLWEGVVKNLFDILLERNDYIDNVSSNRLRNILKTCHFPIQLISNRFSENIISWFKQAFNGTRGQASQIVSRFMFYQLSNQQDTNNDDIILKNEISIDKLTPAQQMSFREMNQNVRLYSSAVALKQRYDATSLHKGAKRKLPRSFAIVLERPGQPSSIGNVAAFFNVDNQAYCIFQPFTIIDDNVVRTFVQACDQGVVQVPDLNGQPLLHTLQFALHNNNNVVRALRCYRFAKQVTESPIAIPFPVGAERLLYFECDDNRQHFIGVPWHIDEE